MLKEVKESQREQQRAREFFLRKLRKRLEHVKTESVANSVNVTAGRDGANGQIPACVVSVPN